MEPQNSHEEAQVLFHGEHLGHQIDAQGPTTSKVDAVVKNPSSPATFRNYDHLIARASELLWQIFPQPCYHPTSTQPFVTEGTEMGVDPRSSIAFKTAK